MIIAIRQSAELWQEFLSVYELIAKIFVVERGGFV